MLLQHSKAIEMTQGSPEWLKLRKKKITATDAPIIMMESPWKTPLQLYNEKISDKSFQQSNERMQRGLDLEPIARDLFNQRTGCHMEPSILVDDWAMASLDGIDTAMERILEIKCPGEKDHSLAKQGKIPDHYFPQLQHQLYVSGYNEGFYFSFDGADGIIVPFSRNEEYIKNMVNEEHKFYDLLQSKTPPPLCERDYVERHDVVWQEYAFRWKKLNESIKQMEEEEEKIRNHLIFLSGPNPSRGGGISLCSYQRKGNVDYVKVPELKNVDLEPYRKASTTAWRITCQ